MIRASKAIKVVITLATAVAFTPAHSQGQVFICTDADGQKLYQQTPCSAQQKTVGSRDVVVVDPPPPRPAETARPANQRQYQEPAQMPAQPATPMPARQVAAFGYTCSAAGESWISRARCPATKRVAVTSPMTGHTMQGAFVTGTATQWQDAPVSERPLSKREYCSESSRLDPSDGVYERNVLGC